MLDTVISNRHVLPMIDINGGGNMGKSPQERQREYRERLKKSGKKQLLVTIDANVHASLLEGAKEKNVTINDLVENVLANAQIRGTPEENYSTEFRDVKADEKFISAMEMFYFEVLNANQENWTRVDKSEVLKFLKIVGDVIKK